MLFEAFNFEYFGPINGHKIDHLIDILNNINYIREPVLLHVTTTKGKGYAPAEKNPVYFHGCGSFEASTGNCLDRKPSAPTYTQVFGQTLLELGAKDPRIVAVTAAMPEGTGLSQFAQAYPERFFDVGIAEQHAVTFAAGLATEGFRPVVAIYSTFLQRAYDQILHDVCIERLRVVFAVDRGGIVGEDGPTHQGLFDLSYLRSLPNMVVMAPKDENELRQMLATALQHDGPVAIRYPRGTAMGVALESPVAALPVGKAELLKDGDDVVILALGRCVSEGLEAHARLAERGVRVTVVNCRFVKPIDVDLIAGVARRVPRIITVEENVRQGGFGSAVLEALNDQGITHVAVARLGVPDLFVEHGAPDVARRHGYADGTWAAARRMLGYQTPATRRFSGRTWLGPEPRRGRHWPATSVSMTSGFDAWRSRRCRIDLSGADVPYVSRGGLVEAAWTATGSMRRPDLPRRGASRGFTDCLLQRVRPGVRGGCRLRRGPEAPQPGSSSSSAMNIWRCRRSLPGTGLIASLLDASFTPQDRRPAVLRFLKPRASLPSSNRSSVGGMVGGRRCRPGAARLGHR
jgi:transketolase C-terminal domain/subunit